MKPPRELQRKMAIHAAIGAAPVAVLIPLALITNDATWAMISIGVSLGLLLGNVLGGRMRINIIRNVYGEKWSEDAVRGRLIREVEEERRNPTPPI